MIVSSTNVYCRCTPKHKPIAKHQTKKTRESLAQEAKKQRLSREPCLTEIFSGIVLIWQKSSKPVKSGYGNRRE
jgi:hypothetical protein